MKNYESALRWIEDFLASVAAASLVGIMCLMLADVAFRYLLSSPIPWSFDVLTRYLLPAAIFFSFSYTLRHNEHLCVEVFYQRIPAGPRDRILGVFYVSAVVIVALAFVASVLTTHRSWSSNELLVGTIHWPIWTSKIIISIGLGVLLVRCADHTARLLTGYGIGGARDLEDRELVP